MAFLALPCQCGWCLDEEFNDKGEITARSCSLCKRRYVLRDWGWDQVTHRLDIVTVTFCRHKRVVDKPCPHCVGGVAKV